MRLSVWQKRVEALEAKRIRVQDAEILPPSYDDPILIGEPIVLVPGFIYNILQYAAISGVDEGDGSMPQLRLHLLGAEVNSAGFGIADALAFAGGGVPGASEVMTEDRIYVISGGEVQLALSSARNFGDGVAEATTTLAIDEVAISIIG